MRLKLKREEINLLKEIIDEAIIKEMWEKHTIINLNEKEEDIKKRENESVSKIDKLRIIKGKLYKIPMYENKKI